MATKTLLNLEVKEIEGDKFNMVMKAGGEQIKTEPVPLKRNASKRRFGTDNQ